MLISEMLRGSRCTSISTIALATTGVTSSDILLAVYTATMNIERAEDGTITNKNITYKNVVYAGAPHDKVVASRQYHGIPDSILSTDGYMNEDEFAKAAIETVAAVTSSNFLLVYNIDFLRKFLARVSAFIPVGPGVVDITALDRLVRSKTAIRLTSSESHSLDLASACQYMGPGTLKAMRRAHGIAEPNPEVDIVPRANCDAVMKVFETCLDVNIPTIVGSGI